MRKVNGQEYLLPKNWNGDCDCNGGSAAHYTYETKPIHNRYSNGMTQNFIVATPKPDSKVCEREIAWRKYVRLRDAGW